MANNETRDYGTYDSTTNKVVTTKEVNSISGTFIGKVFLAMLVGLFITALVSIGIAYAYAFLINLATAENIEGIVNSLLVIVSVSGIGLIIMSFALPIVFVRGKHNILIPSIIYTILMGAVLSIIVLFTDPEVLVLALGSTIVIFGLLTIIGFTSKGNMSGLTTAIIGLFSGLIILVLFNLLFGWIFGDNMFSWIISFGFFGLVMLVTIWDMHRIKAIAQKVEGTDNNLVLYCAYCIYSDFIALLIRLIYYIGLVKGRK